MDWVGWNLGVRIHRDRKQDARYLLAVMKHDQTSKNEHL
jgi:hypothetical protein